MFPHNSRFGPKNAKDSIFVPNIPRTFDVLLCILPNGLLMFSCSLSFDCSLISRGDLRHLFCKISKQIKERKFRNDLPWDWKKFKYDGNFKDYGHVENFETKEDLDRIEIWANFVYLSEAGLSRLGFLSTNSINPETLASVSTAEGWNCQSWDFASVIASFSTECSFEKRLIIEALWILNQRILKQNYRSTTFLKSREIPRCSNFALRYLCKTSYCTPRCWGNIIILCR